MKINKRGFTLIEILVCVGLISLIGVSSIFGVKHIQKNILIDKLEQINDKILAAVEVYIETDKETNSQLYNKKNAVVIPLNVLVNKGLLTLENTDLKQSDIEDEYVVTALSSSTNPYEGCIDIRTETSWKTTSSSPIYICTNLSNAVVVPSSESNYDIVTRSRYLYTGLNPENYIKYGENVYRIISVEKDDSLILASGDSFGKTFAGYTNSISYYTRSDHETQMNCSAEDPKECVVINGESNTSNDGEVLLSLKDVLDTATIGTRPDYLGRDNIKIFYSYISDLIGLSSNFEVWGWSGSSSKRWYYPEPEKGYKIHLKNCMKITSGNGTSAMPYILENQCTTS